MVAADLTRKEDRDRGVVEVKLAGLVEPLRLLRCVGIYGPNASGKSTVITAAAALRWMVTDSSPRSKPDEKIIIYEPFLLDESSSNSPIELGCDIVHDESILRYSISYGEKAILSETLSKLDGGGETVLIDRKPNGQVVGKLISSSKVNKLYVQEMQPNVAVLSKLAQHGPHKGKDSVRPYFTAIRNATKHKEYSIQSMTQFIGPQDDRFADDEQYRDWIMQHLIKAADVGICGVETHRENFEVPSFIKEELAKIDSNIEIPDKKVVVQFKHQGELERSIQFGDESYGTKKLFTISGDWWALANKPSSLFADELSAGLHPRLLDRIVRAVNELKATDARSQLIFTTHDTGLLEGYDGLPPALRRDQIYLMRKDAKGASELYSLAEFKEEARPVHNIRKRYLSGLYGAIPSVERLSL